jgi:hypothetical protein
MRFTTVALVARSSSGSRGQGASTAPTGLSARSTAKGTAKATAALAGRSAAQVKASGYLPIGVQLIAVTAKAMTRGRRCSRHNGARWAEPREHQREGRCGRHRGATGQVGGASPQQGQCDGGGAGVVGLAGRSAAQTAAQTAARSTLQAFAQLATIAARALQPIVFGQICTLGTHLSFRAVLAQW